MRQPHTLAVEELLKQLGTDAERGLTESAAQELLRQCGPNELARAAPTPLWRRFLGHFNDFLIWLLLAAAVTAGVLGEWIDALAIMAIVILNGLLGFFQEERARIALESLRKLATPMARVIRDGAPRLLPARELVPGDRIDMEEGDRVPADVRLIEAASLRAEESALTGESVPTDKDAEAVLAPDAPLGDRLNMAFMGTAIAAGRAHAVVVTTGMDTELGRIAGMLAGEEPEPTPLQRRLAVLGRLLVAVCLVLVALVAGLQWLRGGQWLEVFMLAVSLAVAAVPEGLPAVVTIALALGLQRMARRNALVRQLPSVETLGSVTVICSDKTGTLTRNAITVTDILAGGEWFQVTGSGYAPEGEFRKGGKPEAASSEAPAGSPIEPRDQPDLLQVLRVGRHCNNARLERGEGADAGWRVIGDPTEGALLVAAGKAGLTVEKCERLAEEPFSSKRRMMSVLVRGPDNQAVVYAKGAPEVILERCQAEQRAGRAEPLTDERRQAIAAAAEDLARRARRVLALAYREAPGGDRVEESDLIFAGLAGMIDPPREEAAEAVARCHEAGIRPIMITGDHPATALAIASELRIARPEDQAVSGQELDAMADGELAERVERIAVYARASAAHKMRIIKAWKRRGQIVAMTGDGVNDAPAVQSADVGIAMGRAGTDVTREAADIVLTDDNFASIVNAVEEGRGIYDNIRKSLHFLLASNAGEVLFMVGAGLLGWPVPLAPTQILWINLVTDGLPALALVMEPPEPDLMRRPPRPPEEPLITWRRGLVMLLQGALLATSLLIAFSLVNQGGEDGLARARTVAFHALAAAMLLFALSARSPRRSLFSLGLFSNPHLLGAIAISAVLQFGLTALPFAQPVFKTALGLTWEWAVICGAALAPFALLEIAKLVLPYFRSRFAPAQETSPGITLDV